MKKYKAIYKVVSNFRNTLIKGDYIGTFNVKVKSSPGYVTYKADKCIKMNADIADPNQKIVNLFYEEWELTSTKNKELFDCLEKIDDKSFFLIKNGEKFYAKR